MKYEIRINQNVEFILTDEEDYVNIGVSNDDNITMTVAEAAALANALKLAINMASYCNKFAGCEDERRNMKYWEPVTAIVKLKCDCGKGLRIGYGRPQACPRCGKVYSVDVTVKEVEQKVDKPWIEKDFQ